MPSLRLANLHDLAELVSLRNTVNQHLAERHRNQTWPSVTENGVLFAMRHSSVYVSTHGNKLIATLALSTTKPWAIDQSYFSPSKGPLYLTAMAVHPDRQRKGVGRRCLDEVVSIVKAWPGDAIRLDAYDAESGAGEFYRKCGFREVGRASYRNTPLIYFELLV